MKGNDVGPGVLAERALKRHSRHQASLFFAQMGDRAIVAATTCSHGAADSIERRRYFRLLRLELETLSRHRRREARHNQLTLWKPRAFSVARVAAFVRAALGLTPRNAG